MKKKIVLILFITGALLTSIAVYRYLTQVWYFRSSATKTEGMVRDYLQRSSSQTGSAFSNRWSPVIVYTDANGAQQTYIPAFATSPPEFRRGEKVMVYIKGDKIRAEGMDSWFGIYIFAGAGLFLMIAMTIIRKVV